MRDSQRETRRSENDGSRSSQFGAHVGHSLLDGSGIGYFIDFGDGQAERSFDAGQKVTAVDIHVRDISASIEQDPHELEVLHLGQILGHGAQPGVGLFFGNALCEAIARQVDQGQLVLHRVEVECSGVPWSG